MMSDLKSRFMPLFRRSSTATTTGTVSSTAAKSTSASASASASAASSVRSTNTTATRPRSSRSKTSLLASHKKHRRPSETVHEEEDSSTRNDRRSKSLDVGRPDLCPPPPVLPDQTIEQSQPVPLHSSSRADPKPQSTESTVDKSPVELRIQGPSPEQEHSPTKPPPVFTHFGQPLDSVTELEQAPARTQSLVRSTNNSRTDIQTTTSNKSNLDAAPTTTGQAGSVVTKGVKMHRKIWVKRPMASATLVQIKEDDLVDDVRDMILKKYANSLGRSFDSPDVTLRLFTKDREEKILGPEEHMAQTLDKYFPGGQAVDQALVIDVPPKRTPRNSPRVHLPFYPTHDDIRPTEGGEGYFPAMLPIQGGGSPHPASNVSQAGSAGSTHHHSIAVLNTGQVPPLPSPGGRSSRHHRPKFPRNNTSSPTTLTGNPPHAGIAHFPEPTLGHQRTLPDNHGRSGAVPNPPPLPTPPLASLPNQQQVATPPPRVSSPRPSKSKRPSKKNANKDSNLPGRLLDNVPPINVLIVEDNIINLRLLEAFMKRLKVRWSSTMNGRDAVTKWREGGYHLVLMDIQLPVMNGLDATKEIRRLEIVNGVGAFALKQDPSKEGSPDKGATKESDKLHNQELFKSPVIIVALTASSLQSDRHEALAAGCNDFLTKPVNFLWLERKVMEWGCMQALIDYDGWRKWKDFSQNKTLSPTKALTSTLKSASSTTLTPASPTTKTTSNDSSTSPPTNSLQALNDQADSTNTVDTIDTLDSVATTTSSDEIDNDSKRPSNLSISPPQTAPLISSVNTKPIISPTPVPASAPGEIPVPVSASSSHPHRPSPLQSSTSASPPRLAQGQERVRSPRSSASPKDGGRSPKYSPEQRSPKEAGRWKRSSMGKGTGMPGLAEEGPE